MPRPNSPKRDPNEDIGQVSLALEAAQPWGLEAEVLLWALYHLKEHPEATIAEACYHARMEWDV